MPGKLLQRPPNPGFLARTLTLSVFGGFAESSMYRTEMVRSERLQAHINCDGGWPQEGRDAATSCVDSGSPGIALIHRYLGS